MIFDVQAILKTDGARAQLAGQLCAAEYFEKSDITFKEASYSGELVNRSGVLELSACVKGSFLVPCARCMKETEQSFELSIQESLANENAEVSDREAIIPFTGTSIDMDAVIWPEVLLAIDTKYLCKPDCKGLCIHCGADLNENPCDCKTEEIDPRLAGLLDLLQ